ncbi:MAG: hypothetical protein H6876_06330 [Hyphomicrobiaceae bacterium]|nr:hypothetical protein [Hyphomicrobiaceae bacterium]
MLSGLAEFLQRNHPRHHQAIHFQYRIFLKDMIDPFRVPVPGLPPVKPRTIDFAALPLAARPYLTGPYLDIAQNNRFAEVDLLQSRPTQGRIVMLQSGGPVDIDEWRGKLADLNAWLTGGEANHTWTITAHTASTVTLTLQQKLPSVIPFDRRFLAPAALFVGIDVTTRKPVHIPFKDLTAGTYIAGTSGSGKTSALHVLLRSIFANLAHFEAVHLVDGKDGVGLGRYARLHKKIRVLYDEPDVWQLAAELNVLMRERNAQQRAQGIEKATRNFVALVIDELPTFVAKPPKDQQKDHAAFLDNLQRIAMRGRSAGIRMFLVSQSPVADQCPVTLRTNCAMTIAFRLPENAHATALFGTLDAANDPRKLPTGQAIVQQSDTGTISAVQFPFAPLYQPGKFR